ncbi:AAA family ATPase [Desulfobacula sp.]|uniref:AAA family ATPase n=1 Tax=Desulfobacula sp. TaxID=2593537 RepID=UPI002625364E|nr:AAA family ATPase [Desulfobacula sp.]
MKKDFRLPTYEELSKEQDRVLRRTQLKNRSIVYGAPGTGKTVIFLILADRLNRNKQACLCLLYNRILEKMSHSLADDINIKTWHSWFWHFFLRQFNHTPPEIKKFEYDWDGVMDRVDQADPDVDTHTFLLIDEGQDMPPGFYEFMDETFQHIIVSADENQQLADMNSSIKQIRERLDIQPDHCFLLTKNYRNTRQIALLAEHFYCATTADPPKLPEKNGEIPLLVEYTDLAIMIQRIALRHKTHPDHLIGILAPNNTVRANYFDQLAQLGIFSLYTYANQLGNKNKPIAFDRGGIVVINSKSAKGLEFDDVFIVELDKFLLAGPRDERFRKEMYVLISRARERLFFLMDATLPGTITKKILDEFPDDTRVLKTWQQHQEE